MQQTVGREKAKRNIVLFIIGVFIGFIASTLAAVGLITVNPVLALLGALGLFGLILQIIAIICLRNVNSHYANALWCLIFDLILNLVMLIIDIIVFFQEGGNATLSNVSSWLDVASNVAEAGIVVYFVLGTNQLAEENGKGMPLLTRIIVVGYMVIFVLSLAFSLLQLIPAIGENQVVVSVFSIIGLVLYVVRELAYIIFLIRALFRVE